MRVWDVHPGYLSRSHLLGEHREIHAVWTVITEGKKGYANHPETRRWRGRLRQLLRRHQLVVAEMLVRGYNHRSPLNGSSIIQDNSNFGQRIYVDPPHRQFTILEKKYGDEKSGRLPLPQDTGQFWQHHALSILARDEQCYRTWIRKAAAGPAQSISSAAEFIAEVTELVATPAGREDLMAAWERLASNSGLKVTFDQLIEEVKDGRRDWHRLCINLPDFPPGADPLSLQESTFLTDIASLRL